MALFDTTAQVITVFKADTADMKAGLKELKGHEKDLLKAQIDAAEARNKTYSDWIKDLGNVNQALELVGKAVQFGKEAFKAKVCACLPRQASPTSRRSRRRRSACAPSTS
jgi:hypothetical protein